MTAAQQQLAPTPAPPTRSHFNIFRRRGRTSAPAVATTAATAGTSQLPQQTQQQVQQQTHQGYTQQQQQQTFQSSGQYPSQPPVVLSGAPLPQTAPAPRDRQQIQEIFGGNWIFVVFVPYFVLQDTHLRIGLIVGTAVSGGVLVVGLLIFVLNLRKVFPHILEVLMPIIYAVQLGVSYNSEAYKKEIIRTYPFITHSALAGTCLASMLICYPVGYQTAQELVHKMYMTHPDVRRVGLYTTAVLTASLVTSCLLYLAPLCKGYDDEHFNALNLIFRIIYPCVATFLALLFVRFFPGIYLPNLAVVHGLNRRPADRMPAYLLDAMARRPPAILDASMFQSTVDAATKAREASAMQRPSRLAPVGPPTPRTPRYTPGGSHGGMARVPASYMQMDGQTAMPVPLSSPGMMPPYGNQFAPGYGDRPLDAYGGLDDMGGMMVAPGSIPGEPYSVYTYYAAGPPAKPPLAVYAVYGDNDARSQTAQSLSYGGYGTPGPEPLRNVVNRWQQQPQQPQQYHGNRPGLTGRPMYGTRPQYGGSPYAPQDGSSVQIPGRRYMSAGGAGPYGVNVPLGALAGGDPAGVLPPLRHPDAVVTGVMPGAMPPPPSPPLGSRYTRPGVSAGGFGLAEEYGTNAQAYGQPQRERLQPPLPVRRYPPSAADRLGMEPLPPEYPGRMYAGSVSVMPAATAEPQADPYGAEYGVAAEVNQPQFGLDAETSAAPAGAGYASPEFRLPRGSLAPAHDQFGLQAETGSPTLLPRVPSGVAMPPFRQQQMIPPKSAQPPARAPYRSPSPLGDPMGGLPRRGAVPMAPQPDSGGEGFGLDAEVDGAPPALPPPPGPRRVPRAPSPLGSHRGPVSRRTTAGGGISGGSGGGDGFGLDAEVHRDE